MIKHVVFFNFKPEVTDEQRREIVEAVKAMPGEIDVIRDLAVGFDVVKSKRSWDMALVASFDGMGDLEIYSDHPAHVPVKEKLGSLSRDVGTVDFEC
ncbi:MAG TPA: Dabb family protein [Blastocatellia bacterium]|jgi:hypothetical protein|nr:Dabb family protein [Blastocatellia bacterium]